MADKIYVKTEWLDQCAQELKSVEESLRNANNTLSGIQLRRDEGGNLKIALQLNLKTTGGHYSGNNAKDDIQQLASAVSALTGGVQRLSAGVSRASKLFENAEKNSQGMLQSVAQGGSTDIYQYDSGSTSAQTSLIIALGFPQDMSGWTEEMQKKYSELWNTGIQYTNEDGSLVFSTDDMYIVTKTDGAVWVYEKSWDEIKIKKYNTDGGYSETKKEIDINGGGTLEKFKRQDIWPRDDKSAESDNGLKRDKTLFEVGISSSGSASIFHKGSEYDNGIYSSSSSVDIGKVGYVSSLKFGGYTTKTGEETNQAKELGIAASLGVSISAIEAQHTGRIGNDDFGFDYGINSKVLSASAKVDAQVGLVDGKLAARAQLDLEAIAAEVGGEVGVDFMGIEGKIKANVNVGIGCHADIGFSDGKISCDIGASFGIGGSVKFELDYGDFVDNVVSNVKENMDKASETISSAMSYCSSIFTLF